MALNGDTLGDAIADLIDLSALPDEAQDAVRSQWRAIAGVIVSHIVANAEIRIDAGQAIATLVAGASSPPAHSATALTVTTAEGTVGVDGTIKTPTSELTGGIA